MATRLLALLCPALALFACGGAVSDENAADAVGDTGIADTTAESAPSDAGGPGEPRSCNGRPGADHRCGATSSADCCATAMVTGGTFKRFYDGQDFKANAPATVSQFHLDVFEVTVGRFRAFVDALPGSLPRAGAGAHPKVASSGWDARWPIASESGALRAALASPECGATRTWTDAPGPNEFKAINCVSWYEAFAFCAWDRGRLPTEAERNFAAAGGDEQRVYPWSVPPGTSIIDDTFAIFTTDIAKPVGVAAVGSRPKGAARWGHLDLAGNVWEWTADAPIGEVPLPCNDCLARDGWPTGEPRIVHGGGHASLAALAKNGRRLPFLERSENVGIRCAR